jgi:hypothetical protein
MYLYSAIQNTRYRKSDILIDKGGNDSPYVPKSWLFWWRFGSRYVEAAYDTNDMMLIFLKKVVLNFRFLLLVII